MQSFNKQRPVFLNLFSIRFPVTAILSILHRITGVILILLSPFIIYLFMRSLQSADAFAEVAELCSGVFARLLTLLIIWSLAHHFFSGIRFFMIDLEWFTSKAAARTSAWIVLVLGVMPPAYYLLMVML